MLWRKLQLALLLGFAELVTHAALVPSADGLTIYDSVNGITWLADMNLAASNRFGLPLCSSGATPCLNASGSMPYTGAAAWVAAMNAANYLGHSNWQIPTTPTSDSGCTKHGPNGNTFGYDCAASAYGSLYYTALGLKAPNTAVPIPSVSTGPFTNVQPYLYWSSTNQGSQGNNTFSFATGWEGANTLTHVMYLWPMIPGKLPGTPAASGQELQVNPDGMTVYDPVSNFTLLANANLAATNSFGLPACVDASTPAICVNADGGLNLDSANQFIANMNAFNGAGYLNHSNWEMPPIDPSCSGYNCGVNGSPMGEIFYKQFGLNPGDAAVATPNIAVGALHNIQPYLYWTCLGASIQGACSATQPVFNQEFSFSFGNGFEGTDILPNDLFVTAYFVGSPAAVSGPEISEVANAASESPAIAANTWIEIRGANFTNNDTRQWQASDFVNGKMPTQLDQVSVTVNGKNAYVLYISPTLVNVLTPPDALPNGPVQVVVTSHGVSSPPFSVQAQSLSATFFLFGGGPYIAAQHADYSYLGPPTLYPSLTTPAKPNEIVLLYANGFGPTDTPVTSGAETQSGNLVPLPVVKIGGVNATVTFAGLTYPGEFQLNVQIPTGLGNGDQPVTVTYTGQTTQPGAMITIHK